MRRPLVEGFESTKRIQNIVTSFALQDDEQMEMLEIL
jgi:hypothetical protein